MQILTARSDRIAVLGLAVVALLGGCGGQDGQTIDIRMDNSCATLKLEASEWRKSSSPYATYPVVTFVGGRSDAKIVLVAQPLGSPFDPKTLPLKEGCFGEPNEMGLRRQLVLNDNSICNTPRQGSHFAGADGVRIRCPEGKPVNCSLRIVREDWRFFAAFPATQMRDWKEVYEDVDTFVADRFKPKSC